MERALSSLAVLQEFESKGFEWSSGGDGNTMHLPRVFDVDEIDALVARALSSTVSVTNESGKDELVSFPRMRRAAESLLTTSCYVILLLFYFIYTDAAPVLSLALTPMLYTTHY